MGSHMNKARTDEYALRHPIDELVGQNIRMEQERRILIVEIITSRTGVVWEASCIARSIPTLRHFGFSEAAQRSARYRPAGRGIISRIGRKGKIRNWNGFARFTYSKTCLL